MIRAHTTFALRVGCLVALLVVLTGCSGPQQTTSAPATDGLESALAGVPHRSVAPMPPARLAKGLIAPTNRWFSGLVFGNSPQPVFPLPLSFGLTKTGFAFGVPAVTTSAQTITGEYAPAVSVDDASVSAEISAYDEASVTIAQKGADGKSIGSLVIASGSPIVTYTPTRDGTLRLGQPYTVLRAGLLVTTVNGSSYGLLTQGHREGSNLHLANGQTAVWFAVPPGGDAVQLASHVSALRSVSFGYAVKGKAASTTLSYHSVGNTMVAALPSQLTSLTAPASCDLGRYPSVYGTLSLCAGSTLSWGTPTISASDSLDSARLTLADKTELRKVLAKDLASTRALPRDSYFGGEGALSTREPLDHCPRPR